jgi:hypothetical protein
MFQRPFQKALDDYLSGSIGEKNFKGIRVFQRWKFEYNLTVRSSRFAKQREFPLSRSTCRKRLLRKLRPEGLTLLHLKKGKRFLRIWI